jgi:hypothetical protein
MELTNLDIRTPYNEVIALAVDAVTNHDFEVTVAPSGTVEGFTIFDDSGDALLIEMDDIMFLEVYSITMAAGVINSETKSILDRVATSLEQAA